MENGSFGFVNAAIHRIYGDRKFTGEITIRSGKVVWDLNGLEATIFDGK